MRWTRVCRKMAGNQTCAGHVVVEKWRKSKHALDTCLWKNAGKVKHPHNTCEIKPKKSNICKTLGLLKNGEKSIP